MEYMSALQNDFDDFKPSLFELLSEQQLSALLPPSIRYLLALATHRHPRYLLRALNSFDELYALLSLLIERYYLRTFGGSFTENFYSLKRERVLAIKNGEIPRAQLGAAGPVRETLKLRDGSSGGGGGGDIWRNLAVLVGIPYLKRKLDEGYDIHAAPHVALASAGGGAGGPQYRPDETLPTRPTIRQRLLHYYKWFLRNVYPSLNAVYYFSILAFHLAYLFDNTKYASPFLWLIGTRVRRLGAADHKAIAAVLEGKSSPSPSPAATATPAGTAAALSAPTNRLTSILAPQNLYPHLLSSLRIFLPTSIFALKFLEWWHASDFSRQLARKATEAIDLPAPVVTGMSTPASRQAPPSQKPPAVAAAGEKPTQTQTQMKRRHNPPISSTTYLPIFTVPAPSSPSSHSGSSASCPICLSPTLTNPTACQTGYVYCYSCIFRWINGEHERQMDFMSGEGGGEVWDDDDENDDSVEEEGQGEGGKGKEGRSRQGKWESGRGRCAVTGRRVLGGTEGLRRVLV
ncbi:hypothetical protein AJ80_02162 [Polytolypa hystricis UAMH7299]|uniref:Peroxisome assembly protein 12 n=1 Tax=Polytolypa hystricis (strain UAMH7299) TaxID=1447883 RepID=A0A2B7YRW6_POLH7|nr:hypothetical protein AJ80_02162 [Polytolypa hystricis UAMH7299]